MKNSREQYLDDPIYPNYITQRKGWCVYKAYSPRDIPYKAVKLGKKCIYSESYKDILGRIDVAEGKKQ